MEVLVDCIRIHFKQLCDKLIEFFIFPIEVHPEHLLQVFFHNGEIVPAVFPALDKLYIDRHYFAEGLLVLGDDEHPFEKCKNIGDDVGDLSFLSEDALIANFACPH